MNHMYFWSKTATKGYKNPTGPPRGEVRPRMVARLAVDRMPRVAALVCLALANGVGGLRLPKPTLPRRQLTALSLGGLAAAALPAYAAGGGNTKGGVQWSIELPDEFVVQRQLASIVRVRVETMLAADDASTGASVKLLLLPFGQQAGGSLNADEQLALAKHFFDKESSPEGPEIVSATMSTSAARSPTISALSRVGKASGYQAADGTRYVKYGYESTRCSEPLDDGECFGSLSKRRTLATVAMSSLSQYRTNTERERMRELGQERNVNVLWLLTLTAPAASWERAAPALERIAQSFAVPLAPQS